MEIVVEVVGRSGTVIQRQRFHRLPVRLGRSYRNELILNDPWVDPFHCLLDLDADGELVLRDLQSCNGTLLEGSPIETARRLQSGAELTLGKSHLRIIDADQPVAATLLLSPMEESFKQLSRAAIVLPLLCLLVAMLVFEKWLTASAEYPLQETLAALIGLLGLVLLYGGFWALIGRVLRHDSRFVGHCMIAVSAILLARPGELLLQWGAFNLGLLNWMAVLNILLAGAIVLLMLRSSLFLATHLHRWKAHLTALTPALLLVSFGLFSQYMSASEFHSWPAYSEVLFSPDLQLVTPLNEDQFIERSRQVFDIDDER